MWEFEVGGRACAGETVWDLGGAREVGDVEGDIEDARGAECVDTRECVV